MRKGLARYVADMPFYMGDYATTPTRIVRRRNVTEVTVLFLDETFSSTAAGPMEVFRHAGTLWNYLTGNPHVPRFRVRTASIDGQSVRCDGPIHVQPYTALTSIRKTGLSFIPTSGMDVDNVFELYAPVVPWLRR